MMIDMVYVFIYFILQQPAMTNQTIPYLVLIFSVHDVSQKRMVITPVWCDPRGISIS